MRASFRDGPTISAANALSPTTIGDASATKDGCARLVARGTDTVARPAKLTPTPAAISRAAALAGCSPATKLVIAVEASAVVSVGVTAALSTTAAARSLGQYFSISRARQASLLLRSRGQS
jgi:hypothetical protein